MNIWKNKYPLGIVIYVKKGMIGMSRGNNLSKYGYTVACR